MRVNTWLACKMCYKTRDIHFLQNLYLQIENLHHLLIHHIWRALPLSATAAACPGGRDVTGLVGIEGTNVGCGSVKEGTSKFQNAIFSGSILAWMEEAGLKEIYCSSSRVYTGHLSSGAGLLFKRFLNLLHVQLIQQSIYIQMSTPPLAKPPHGPPTPPSKQILKYVTSTQALWRFIVK